MCIYPVKHKRLKFRLDLEPDLVKYHALKRNKFRGGTLKRNFFFLQKLSAMLNFPSCLFPFRPKHIIYNISSPTFSKFKIFTKLLQYFRLISTCSNRSYHFLRELQHNFQSLTLFSMECFIVAFSHLFLYFLL